MLKAGRAATAQASSNDHQAYCSPFPRLCSGVWIGSIQTGPVPESPAWMPSMKDFVLRSRLGGGQSFDAARPICKDPGPLRVQRMLQPCTATPMVLHEYQSSQPFEDLQITGRVLMFLREQTFGAPIGQMGEHFQRSRPLWLGYSVGKGEGEHRCRHNGS